MVRVYWILRRLQ